jgi:hypothetical protein
VFVLLALVEAPAALCGCSRSSESATSSSAAAPPALAPQAQQKKTTQVVQGDNLTITEHEAGQVSVQGIDQWKEKVDTTYSDCDYFRRAIPVMERQFGKERAQLLRKVCVSP